MASNDNTKPTHHRSASTPNGAGGGTVTQPLSIPAPSHSSASPNVSSPPANRPRRGSILSMFGLSPPPAPLAVNTDSRVPGLSHSPSSSTDSAESYGLAQSLPAQPSVWPQDSGKQSAGPQSPLSSWLRQLHDHAEEDDALGQAPGAGQGMARISRTTSRPDYGPVGMGPGSRRLSFGWPSAVDSAASPGAGVGSPGGDDAGQFGLFRRMSLGSRAQPPAAGAPFVKDLPSTFDESAPGAAALDRGREPISRRRNSAARRPSPMGERILRGEGGWPH